MAGAIAEPVSSALGPRKTAGRSVPRHRGAWQGRALVVGEALFRDVLVRERKRADRFAQPFVLVLVAAHGAGPLDAAVWDAVMASLAAVKRDTDVVGWFEQGSSIGMLVPEIDAADASFTSDITVRVSAALASHVDAEAAVGFSIRAHRYSGVAAAAQPPETEDASPLHELPVSTAAKVQMLLKRALDLIVGALLLMMAAPLFLAIAALIKATSRGPVFFRQPRVGEHGKLFTMLKFRTMKVDADSAIHKEFVSQLIQGATPSGAGASEDAPFKIVNDPRVTAIGRVLRQTSLDELPQLWNVVRGDMSLVGPRPPLTYEVEQYKPWHYRRVLEAKPGITGLWQVSGRSQTTFDDMVRLDLRYAKTCSTWTDLKILLATPRAVISGKGAR